MIPLVHDSEGDRVPVFGGGFVGARKARVLATEASVFAVSPSAHAESDGDAQLPRAVPTAAPREKPADRGAESGPDRFRTAAGSESVWKALDTESSNSGQVETDVNVEATGDRV